MHTVCFRAFSEGVAATNKISGGQAFRTLPYTVELRPKMGAFGYKQNFNSGFLFPTQLVSHYSIIYL